MKYACIHEKFVNLTIARFFINAVNLFILNQFITIDVVHDDIFQYWAVYHPAIPISVSLVSNLHAAVYFVFVRITVTHYYSFQRWFNL